MYLPLEIPKARVLIAVKTYPNPSIKYDELVCNAGFLENGQWVRVYPIRFRALPYAQQYSKFDWIELDLVKKHDDFRQESYRPKKGVDEEILTIGTLSTGKQRDWSARKEYALREVFTSMSDLIKLAKAEKVWKSLATVKPKEITKFEVEPDERDWKPQIKEGLQQLRLFEQSSPANTQQLQVVSKLPYKYY